MDTKFFKAWVFVDYSSPIDTFPSSSTQVPVRERFTTRELFLNEVIMDVKDTGTLLSFNILTICILSVLGKNSNTHTTAGMNKIKMSFPHHRVNTV